MNLEKLSLKSYRFKSEEALPANKKALKEWRSVQLYLQFVALCSGWTFEACPYLVSQGLHVSFSVVACVSQVECPSFG